MKLLEVENIATDIKLFGSRMVEGSALIRNMGFYRAEVRLTDLTHINLYNRILRKIKDCGGVLASKYAGMRVLQIGLEGTAKYYLQLEIEAPVAGEMSMWPQEICIGFYRVNVSQDRQRVDNFVGFAIDHLFILQKAIPDDCKKRGCMITSSDTRGEQLSLGTQLPCGCLMYTIPPVVMVGFYRVFTLLREGDYNHDFAFFCEIHHGEKDAS